VICWIWIPVTAIFAFVVGGITGGIVTCIPFQKALKQAQQGGKHE